MHKNDTAEYKNDQDFKHQRCKLWDELRAAFLEKKAREKRERNSREMVHALIRRHYAGIIKNWKLPPTTEKRFC